MKKLAILTVAMLFAFSAVQAQKPATEKGKTAMVGKENKTAMVPLKKLEGTMVNQTSLNSFIADFGNIKDVKWKRGLNFDEASFRKDNHDMTAYYDSEGKLVGTTYPVDFKSLPAKGQQTIHEKYKDYKEGTVIFFDDNDQNDSDMVLWATQFNDEDLYFAELSKGAERIIVIVKPDGEVSLFKKL
jgi:hypothetical protein